MTARPSSALARCLSSLRRWLRYTWMSRLPLAGWFRDLGERFAASGNGRRRPRLPKGEPRRPVSLDLLVLERRFSPIDVIGLSVSALGMPMATPGMILLEGWPGPRTAFDAPAPVAVAGSSSPLLSEKISAEQLAGLALLWGWGGDSPAEAPAGRTNTSGPAATLADGGGPGVGVGGDAPYGDLLGDGQFWNRAAGAGGLRLDLSGLQKQMDVDLLTPPKGGGGLPPHDPGNLMAQPFTAAAPPPRSGVPSGGVAVGGGVGQQSGSSSGTGIAFFAPAAPAFGPGQASTTLPGSTSAGTATPAPMGPGQVVGGTATLVSPLQPQGVSSSSVVIGPTGGMISPATATTPSGTTSATASGISANGKGTTPPPVPQVLRGLGSLPFAFEVNQGQVDPSVQFLVHGPGFTLSLTGTGSVLTLSYPGPNAAPSGPNGLPDPRPASPPAVVNDVLHLDLVGINAGVKAVGEGLLQTRTNYFIGNDPAQWHTDIPNYGQVVFPGIYPGVDEKYYTNSQGELETDYVVGPGTDPGVIRLAVSGASGVSLDGKGNLVLATAGGGVIQRAPVMYQDINGVRQDVSGQYVVQGNEVGFQVGAYDPSQPLVIDPALLYSTYLGGSAAPGAGAIAVDGSGNAYIANSSGGYVSKLNASDTALVYQAYAGGSRALAIAVDGSGNAYIAGAHGYPFVSKLNASGTALLYTTYLGGSAYGNGYGIAVDSAGDAYVTGNTEASDFPTVNPVQSSLRGPSDAFVSELNPSGSSLIYSTYLGGSGDDQANAIAVDGSGNAYVTGLTESSNFPTASALQSSLRSGGAAFVTKLNASGTTLVYSTYLGGSAGGNSAAGYGIAVDASGNAYVTGYVAATDFPTANALQSSFRGHAPNAFVSKLNAAGTSLAYSTYLGGGEGAGLPRWWLLQ